MSLGLTCRITINKLQRVATFYRKLQILLNFVKLFSYTTKRKKSKNTGIFRGHINVSINPDNLL